VKRVQASISRLAFCNIKVNTDHRHTFRSAKSAR